MIFSFFDFFILSYPLYFFCSLNFIVRLPISYKILPYYVYYYCILIISLYVVGTFFFFRIRFTSFHPHASLLTFSFFVLFHFVCSHARMFGKTLVHELHISYSHTELYLFFSDSATTSALSEYIAYKYSEQKVELLVR